MTDSTPLLTDEHTSYSTPVVHPPPSEGSDGAHDMVTSYQSVSGVDGVTEGLRATASAFGAERRGDDGGGEGDGDDDDELEDEHDSQSVSSDIKAVKITSSVLAYVEARHRNVTLEGVLEFELDAHFWATMVTTVFSFVSSAFVFLGAMPVLYGLADSGRDFFVAANMLGYVLAEGATCILTVATEFVKRQSPGQAVVWLTRAGPVFQYFCLIYQGLAVSAITDTMTSSSMWWIVFICFWPTLMLAAVLMCESVVGAMACIFSLFAPLAVFPLIAFIILFRANENLNDIAEAWMSHSSAVALAVFMYIAKLLSVLASTFLNWLRQYRVYVFLREKCEREIQQRRAQVASSGKRDDRDDPPDDANTYAKLTFTSMLIDAVQVFTAKLTERVQVLNKFDRTKESTEDLWRTSEEKAKKQFENDADVAAELFGKQRLMAAKKNEHMFSYTNHSRSYAGAYTSSFRKWMELLLWFLFGIASLLLLGMGLSMLQYEGPNGRDPLNSGSEKASCIGYGHVACGISLKDYDKIMSAISLIAGVGIFIMTAGAINVLTVLINVGSRFKDKLILVVLVLFELVSFAAFIKVSEASSVDGTEGAGGAIVALLYTMFFLGLSIYQLVLRLRSGDASRWVVIWSLWPLTIAIYVWGYALSYAAYVVVLIKLLVCSTPSREKWWNKL